MAPYMLLRPPALSRRRKVKYGFGRSAGFLDIRVLHFPARVPRRCAAGGYRIRLKPEYKPKYGLRQALPGAVKRPLGGHPVEPNVAARHRDRVDHLALERCCDERRAWSSKRKEPVVVAASVAEPAAVPVERHAGNDEEIDVSRSDGA